MKSFDKIKILDNINNIEIKKTINKFLDGLVSMEKNCKDVFVSNFSTPLEFKYVERILKNLDLNYDIIFVEEDYERKFIIFYNILLFIIYCPLYSSSARGFIYK